MGIIVNEDTAKATPCRCLIFGDKEKAEDRLCFSSGVVGALSDEQEGEYCTDILAIETSEQFARRIERFETLGDIMNVCLESDQEDFLACIENQAREMRKEREG